MLLYMKQIYLNVSTPIITHFFYPLNFTFDRGYQLLSFGKNLPNGDSPSITFSTNNIILKP